jgi:hypothetical protein
VAPHRQVHGESLAATGHDQVEFCWRDHDVRLSLTLAPETYCQTQALTAVSRRR